MSAAAFALEAAALACAARWGWWAGSGGATGALAALGSAALWATTWGVFVSPRARVRLSPAATTFGRALLVAVAAVGGLIAGWGTFGAALVIAWLVVAVAEAAR
ncbi:DUF2568 domain-containing protein [Motilibacter aurantiacus]|uniref:DUF2568 domain-containing protein n=1 Tax=Motilibacter aurantiacus TaxID=2714955 RepID=UPI001E5F545A|nr:DUF2568 domain-containing protein [Motilibacter aurantiacus]